MTTPIRVLVVDDRALSRDALRISLLRYKCELVEVSSGAEALAAMAVNEFDISFIDLRLPDMSGIDVLATARSRSYAIGLPVVVTGEPKPSTPEEARTHGARFLTKPLELKDVRAVLHEAVPNAVAVAPSFTLAAKPQTPERSSVLRRLLVLDDNQTFLNSMKNAFGNEFDLDLTMSPEDAIASVAATDYELVILDMKLPETTGLEVLRRMREFAPDVRAVILTGHDDDDNWKYATQAGQLRALEYVKKDGATLTTKIHRILLENPRRMHVFFCYAHLDQARVDDYYERLTKRGFQIFKDDHAISGGKEWERTISEEIQNAQRFIYFLSNNSYNRTGPMRYEINEALERQKTFTRNSAFFIPARLEQCGIEKDFKYLQVVDLFLPNGFARLLEALTTD
jgi:CheY-like chemotaxis protein